MSRLKFNIKYRPQIESGEYKVETRDGSPVRVVCWDANSYTPIVFLVTKHDDLDDKDKEYTYSCNNFGRAFSIESPRDLFIVTPEEEMTKIREEMKEFIESEKQVVLCSESDGKACIKWDTKSIDTAIMLLKACIDYLEKNKSFRPADCRYDYRFATHVDNIVTPEEELSEFENRLCEILHFSINYKIHSTDEETIKEAKKLAPELLSIAHEQFIKDGYVIEKKAFHDAVENISDKHQAEMSVEYSSHCKVENGVRHAVMNWDEFQKVAQKFIDIGKAEALKDLPRWRKASGKERFSERMIVLAGDNDLYCTNYAEEGEYYLPFPILEKLPKEDSNE